MTTYDVLTRIRRLYENLANGFGAEIVAVAIGKGMLASPGVGRGVAAGAAAGLEGRVVGQVAVGL